MIQINNTNYKFKLGFKALRMFQDETGLDLMELGDNAKLSTILKLAYYGMVSQGETITIEELENAIDDDPKLLGVITNLMTDGIAAFNALALDAKN